LAVSRLAPCLRDFSRSWGWLAPVFAPVLLLGRPEWTPGPTLATWGTEPRREGRRRVRRSDRSSTESSPRLRSRAHGSGGRRRPNLGDEP